MFNIYLGLINIGIFLICLFIIRDIAKIMTGTKGLGVASTIIHLHSAVFIRSWMIIISAITLWVIAGLIGLLEGMGLFYIFGLYEAMSIAAGITLSYGLYLLISPFKKLRDQNLENSKRNRVETGA